MAIRTYGPNAVDWEQRVDLERLRTERLARLNQALNRSELGAVLSFDFANIRYLTSTHIGNVFATYRGHHHALARGATPEECLAELMSRATGLCGAKGGSMHLTKASKGMLGSYAIVGAHLPMAVGAAWSARPSAARRRLTGDGATTAMAFHGEYIHPAEETVVVLREQPLRDSAPPR